MWPNLHVKASNWKAKVLPLTQTLTSKTIREHNGNREANLTQPKKRQMTHPVDSKKKLSQNILKKQKKN